MTRQPRVLVFIPAYRCEDQISRVLSQFDYEIQSFVDTVIVVDNRSHDKTLDVAILEGSKIFSITNFIVWKNNFNYGLGGSHKVAFRFAVENGFDFIVVLHGDDQADIHDLIPILKTRMHFKFDCLLGARFMKGSRLQGYSLFRTIGNIVFNALFSLILGYKINDLGSGLNLYRVSALDDFYYEKFPDDLTFNYVMLISSYCRNHSIAFFPISWREDDQRSNVKMIQQSLRVIKLLTSYFLRRENFLTTEMRDNCLKKYFGKIQYQQGTSCL